MADLLARQGEVRPVVHHEHSLMTRGVQSHLQAFNVVTTVSLKFTISDFWWLYQHRWMITSVTVYYGLECGEQPGPELPQAGLRVVRVHG